MEIADFLNRRVGRLSGPVLRGVSILKNEGAGFGFECVDDSKPARLEICESTLWLDNSFLEVDSETGTDEKGF